MTGNGFVEQAYRLIRQRILDNVYPAGYRALEREFAEELGLSRTPVREALLRLEAEGLLELIPRHGARVLPVSAADMREIYEVLTALESMAAEIVTRRKPNAAELRPLSSASKDMADALRKDDLDAWARADEHFHRQLLELAGNAVLIQTVQQLWDRAHRARMVTLRLRPRPIHSTKEHNAIVESIRAGDPEATVRRYRAHRQRASIELLAILEKTRLGSV
ncbi:MAG: GntR family transcriptional regulator [Lautropia sp.]|nr:GntR family transcriptional regulator [Lautropia sp.]